MYCLAIIILMHCGASVTNTNSSYVQTYLAIKLILILIVSKQFKSNQITFIVTSPQHKCLGEWNSYERAPDSAKKTKQFTYGQTVQKNFFTYGQTVQKKLHWSIYSAPDSAKKTTAIYIWTVHI